MWDSLTPSLVNSSSNILFAVATFDELVSGQKLYQTSESLEPVLTFLPPEMVTIKLGPMYYTI